MSLDYDTLLAKFKAKWGKDKVKKQVEDGVDSVGKGNTKKSGEEGHDKKEEEGGSDEEKMREGVVDDKEVNRGKKKMRVMSDEEVRVVKKRKEEDPNGKRKIEGDKQKKKQKSDEDMDQTETTPRPKITITIPKRVPALPLPSSSRPAATLFCLHILDTPSALSSLPSSQDQSPSFPEHNFNDSSHNTPSDIPHAS